jgi:hypothetical protein
MENKLDELRTLVIDLHKKVDNLQAKMDEEMVPECKKMGTHIDFVENVYDNVKHPLGYICNRVRYYTGGTTYTLTNKDNK